MDSLWSMQKKIMGRTQLPGNSSKKLQISVQKVSTREKYRSWTPEILKNGVSVDDFSV